MEFTENVNFESGGHLYVTASENGGKLTKGHYTVLLMAIKSIAVLKSTTRSESKNSFGG